MKTRLTDIALTLMALSTLNLQLSTAIAQGTAFTYQGRLNNNGAPANGSYDLQFALFATNITGVAIAGPVTNAAVAVSNGLFTTTVDFGNVFTGGSNWLQIAVSTNGANAFFTLLPRQQVTPTPYAVFANTASNLSGAVSSANLAGTYGNAVTLNNAGNNIVGSFTGNGAGVTNVNAANLDGLNAASFWQLGGNTVANGQFLGSANNQPLELRVNGQRALRLEPTTNTPNVIAGSAVNRTLAGVVGAVIGGGGDGNIGENAVSDSYGTIAGGVNNLAGDLAGTIGDAAYATVGGGYGNISEAQAATVAGGYGNNATFAYATVGGGYFNYAGGQYATVGGGSGNTAYSGASTVGGGYFNTASNSSYGTVGGGYYNTAGGVAATVPGGYENTAFGNNSFAAGRYAQAVHDHSFIWSSYPNFAPTFGDNTFFVSAQNGIGINCGQQRVSDGGGQYWMNLGNVIGSDLIETSVGAHLTTSGVWANNSDKNRKTDFVPVNSREILEKLSALSVRQWRYTNELAGIKHLGPTAQDFKSTFGLGTDDKSIGTVDEEGVALAAIQGLNQKVEEKDSRIQEQESSPDIS